MERRKGGRPYRRIVFALLVLVALAVPAIATGHIERASYWPDPTPDTTIHPAAGGQVPTVRSLASAVKGKHRKHKRQHKHKHKPTGKTRVVC